MGWGGAGSKVVPGGNGVDVGRIRTPGITALISSTRTARVGVLVGVHVVVGVGENVAVGVDVTVGVLVGEGVRDGVYVTVSDGSRSIVGSAAVDCTSVLKKAKVSIQAVSVNTANMTRRNM